MGCVNVKKNSAQQPVNSQRSVNQSSPAPQTTAAPAAAPPASVSQAAKVPTTQSQPVAYQPPQPQPPQPTQTVANPSTSGMQQHPIYTESSGKYYTYDELLPGNPNHPKSKQVLELLVPFSDLSEDIVHYINLVRTQPEKFAQTLEGHLQYFNDDRIEVPGEVAIKCDKANYEQQIAYFKGLQPLPAITCSSALTYAAQALLNEKMEGKQQRAWTDHIAAYCQLTGGAGMEGTYSGDMPEILVRKKMLDPDQRKNWLSTEMEYIGLGAIPGEHGLEYNIIIAMSIAAIDSPATPPTYPEGGIYEKENDPEDVTPAVVDNTETYRKIAIDIFNQTNWVRQHPQDAANYVEKEYLPKYKGNQCTESNGWTHTVPEGQPCCEELIRELRATKSLHPYGWNYELAAAAQDHANDLERNGHTGSDGSNPTERVRRYGKGGAGENIAWGLKTGLGTVVQLLLDDGTPSRGHRKGILNKDYRLLGVGSGPDKKFQIINVQDFASSIGRLGDAPCPKIPTGLAGSQAKLYKGQFY